MSKSEITSAQHKRNSPGGCWNWSCRICHPERKSKTTTYNHSSALVERADAVVKKLVRAHSFAAKHNADPYGAFISIVLEALKAEYTKQHQGENETRLTSEEWDRQQEAADAQG
jgi:hypothetical protein